MQRPQIESETILKNSGANGKNGKWLQIYPVATESLTKFILAKFPYAIAKGKPMGSPGHLLYVLGKIPLFKSPELRVSFMGRVIERAKVMGIIFPHQVPEIIREDHLQGRY